MRSVPCLLFNTVGRLVSHNSVIFRLLVHHINLLILPFLSLLDYTIFKSIPRRRGRGSENTSSHRRRRPDASSRWSKWGRQFERSWLLVIGSWSAGHSHSYQGVRGTSINENEGFLVEGGELANAKERSGDTEESSGQWSVWWGSRSLTNSDQLFAKDWQQSDHIWEYLPPKKAWIAIAKSGKVCLINRRWSDY